MRRSIPQMDCLTPTLDGKMFRANFRKKARHFFGLQYLPNRPMATIPPAAD
ncbi:MAG: hypothetical protein OK454_08745 [Thaumarchaeota archaeon]|nr:hypothetical protein [Nitrososphaerota archaeon]